MMKIGFIGLGIMGRPMAHNLVKAGYSLVVHNRRRTPVEELVQAGAKAAASSREVAERTEIVITMLPDSPQVEEVVLGKNGILEADLKPGFILVDMSSIAPLVAQQVEKAVASKGGEMLDAPVSGGQPGAIAGTLAIMVGGKPEIFKKVKPLFEVLGNGGTLVGPIGAGNITCNRKEFHMHVNHNNSTSISSPLRTCSFSSGMMMRQFPATSDVILFDTCDPAVRTFNEPSLHSRTPRI